MYSIFIGQQIKLNNSIHCTWDSSLKIRKIVLLVQNVMCIQLIHGLFNEYFECWQNYLFKNKIILLLSSRKFIYIYNVYP